MNYHILTLFPDMFDSYFDESIIARARESKIISINTYNIRDYSTDKNRKVDDRPFGGGPGMVMAVDPVIRSIDDVIGKIEKKYQKDVIKYEKAIEKYKTKLEENKLKKVSKPEKVIKPKIKVVMFSPGGISFDTSIAKEAVNSYTDIIFICGRYEGVDSRVIDICNDNKLDISEWSVGSYVLTGGELAAMICVDSISRQVSSVLGKYESLEEERVSSHKMYTRPPVYEYKKKVINKKETNSKKENSTNAKIKKYSVPEVLMSGNHKLIDEWKNNSK